MTRRRPSQMLVVVATALVALALSGACCDDTCIAEDVDAGPDEPTALFTEGCAVEDITITGDVVCARCDDGVICGDARPARCERANDELGEPCRYCETDLREVLYNSCFDVSPNTPGLRCESSGVVDDPNFAEDTECAICTDESGLVTEQRCGPASDECHPVVDQGRDCSECTKDGEVVALTCEQPDILPRSCEVYENEVGRCIDCFGDDDQLLSHFCTFTADLNKTCVDTITPDVFCHTCTDANGFLLEQFCDQNITDLQQCALLEYSEQTCVMCVDEFNQIGRSECEAKCDDPGVCEPPPSCFFSQTPDGLVCRTCPTSFGTEETQCLFETNLSCSDVASEDGQVCFECVEVSSGQQVYRSCENFIPPTCSLEQNLAGEECELCEDSSTGAPLYANCPSQTCQAAGSFGVVNRNGLSLFVDNQPAVATCTSCYDFEQGDAEDVCTLRADCGEPGLIDPDVSCESAVVFSLRPLDCDNPWQLDNYGLFQSSYDELIEILTWSLDIHGFAPVALQRPTFLAGVDGECANECCPRGDVIELVVRPQDAAAARELYGPVITPCASDADCAVGDTCRADGGCG